MKIIDKAILVAIAAFFGIEVLNHLVTGTNLFFRPFHGTATTCISIVSLVVPVAILVVGWLGREPTPAKPRPYQLRTSGE